MKKQKPNAFDKPDAHSALIAATEQDYRDKHSLRVASRRAIVLFEIAELEREIVGLNAALTSAKERRAQCAAIVVGLERVIAKRS